MGGEAEGFRYCVYVLHRALCVSKRQHWLANDANKFHSQIKRGKADCERKRRGNCPNNPASSAPFVTQDHRTLA